MSFTSLKKICLVDCDSFYCSVQKTNDPKLTQRPVVVLSNNGGCVVSASREAKALGFKVGDVYFKIKDKFEMAGGVPFLSNFKLYGEYSARLKKILFDISPDLEDYSIDEAFLDVTEIPNHDELEFVLSIKRKVYQYLALPISAVIAPTKVLAKVAMVYAKKNGGVYVLQDRNKIDEILKSFPVEEIWGIAEASALKLRLLGIRTAYQLMKAPEALILKTLTVVGARIQLELRGISAIELETDIKTKKQIIVSRSFEQGIYVIGDIEKKLSDHIFKASKKLRVQSQSANVMTVFIHTNPFKDVPQYYNSTTINLGPGTNAPHKLISSGLRALKTIFKNGYEYKKCGVMLNDLRPQNEKQLSFLEEEDPRDEKLTSVIDAINRKFPFSGIKIMSCTLKEKDTPLVNMSPNYLGDWNGLLVVNI